MIGVTFTISLTKTSQAPHTEVLQPESDLILQM